MSSSEQAPEPTMDEILASIRRIIAEDDDGAGKQQEASEQSAPEAQAEETERSELAESIAETLHQEDAMTSAVEEVLELTEEVEQIAVAASQAGDPPPQPEVSDFEADATMSADPIPPETEGEGIGDVTEVLVTEVLVTEQVITEAEEDPAPPMGEIPGVTQDAEFEVEEASGQPDISEEAEAAGVASESEPSFQSSSIAEAVEAIARGIEPEPEAEEQEAGEDQPDSSFYGASAQAEAANALAAETADIEAEEAAVGEGFGAATAVEDEETSEASAIEERPETEQAPDALDETLSPTANGPGALGSSPQSPTLETSVKEMLRPMLREWLDDNLPRIIENAVKDEIASSDKLKD